MLCTRTEVTQGRGTWPRFFSVGISDTMGQLATYFMDFHGK